MSQENTAVKEDISEAIDVLVEDVVGAEAETAQEHQGVMGKRTKIVFFDSDDDEAKVEGGAPRERVVQTVDDGYLLSTDKAELEADDEEGTGLTFVEDLNGTGAVHDDDEEDPIMPAHRIVSLPGGYGLETAEQPREVRTRRPRRIGDLDRTDPLWAVGKRMRLGIDSDQEEEESKEDGEGPAKPSGPLDPGYEFTLREEDVQEVFSEEEGEDEEGDDVEDLDDEEEEERFDDVLLVAAVEQFVDTCEKDEDTKDDQRYQQFAVKAKGMLEEVFEQKTTPTEMMEALAEDMQRLKRIHSRFMRPPKNEPIVVDGVLTDL